jgi:hypothetical protein
VLVWLFLHSDSACLVAHDTRGLGVASGMLCVGHSTPAMSAPQVHARLG